ncbi:hypothetical protein SNE35_24840 [Paucibacter sp. R3-3]|uniref:DUF4288 domain-containing protein n=1 Tax=Roseateles agri TaxID=3098619 RepID=A0ABU5DN62_9BURK|nr:hypothetical protein [Paucibacter sp. R3-3]MDY0747754.1 hypothetical protein [Paucibacter sp. R3-3]
MMETTVEIGLFAAWLKVRLNSADTADRPEDEALVPVFACAADYQAALRFAVAEVRAIGDQFLDVHGDVQQLDPAGWSSYVADVWPEFQHELPTREEVLQGLVAGRVYFGPFIAYTAEAQPGTAADGSAAR